MATILDVVDSYFDRGIDFSTVPERALVHFGEEVRRFAASYQSVTGHISQHPSYIGGWPSANILHEQHNKLVMSSLLYSGQILAKDPICNWFSNEQYQFRRPMSKRPGYLTLKGEFNLEQTKVFLSTVIPSLWRLKPLIDKNIVFLIPSDTIEAAIHNNILEVLKVLIPEIARNPRDFAHKFAPIELATDDSVRGMFVFAGGNQEEQIIKHAIEPSLYYFSREFCLAQHLGFEYTAPFAYEQWICENGLSQLSGPGQKVVNAILNSPLPLYEGLTPELLADLKDDENYAEFRTQLYNLYRDIPITANQSQLRKYIAEAEEALLNPILTELKQSKKGPLAKMSISYAGGMKLASRILIDLVISSPASLLAGAAVASKELLKTGSGNIIDRLFAGKKKQGARVIWKKLHQHNLTFGSGLEYTQNFQCQELEIDQSGKEQQVHKKQSSKSYWGIPNKASMEVHISEGALISDYMPQNIKRQET